ncbi:LysR substrate-binding domain-containing protein [Neisseria dumasiana]|uniref:Transcriptional regulator n=1 Tax=Neisseria dumasiana TaxID=1931275 RepID=A0A1X3DGU4_9NEIS|nr:LysR substrate-binding domain-containing protein [Neisseria dumasiana]OSI18667.1 transcriptional regulator [Neisseria dumasiana]
MRKPNCSLDALYAFEAAARTGSFKSAAAELNVTATAISHRIRLLEMQLGKPLFVRKVRAVSLTAEGRILFDAAAQGFAVITTALERICEPVRQVVSISVTPEFAGKWLVPKLAAFQTAFPNIDLHIHASYEPADLKSGAADLAVRYGNGHYPEVQSTPLFQECFAPVASPALLAKLPKNVRDWPLIHLDWHRDTHDVADWNKWADAAGVPHADVQSGIRYSDGSHAIQAAVAGQGVALLSVKLVREELDLRLLSVAAEPCLHDKFYWLCEPQRYADTSAVQQVKAWLLVQAAKDSM